MDCQKWIAYYNLKIAIFQKDHAKVQELLQGDVDVNVKDANDAGKTLLHIAVEIGDLSLVRMLLDRGAENEGTDETPLGLASKLDSQVLFVAHARRVLPIGYGPSNQGDNGIGIGSLKKIFSRSMEAKLGVEKLNNENYAQWAFETEMLLIREKLWKYVEYAQAPVPENDEWTDGVQRARATISLLVERRQHPLIRELKTAKEVWLKLKNEHQKTSMCSRVSLICQICDRKLPEGGDVATHIYDLEELFAKLRSAGKDLGEDVQVAMLLRSLPMSYDQVRTALLIMKDEDLKLDYVKGKILDQERKMNEGEAGDTTVAYKVAFKRKLICYGCGKEGHRKVDCPAEMSDDDVEVNASKKSYAFVLDTSKRQEWIVDSGASSHVCCMKACFDSLKPAPRGQVLLANGKEVDVQGIGTVSLNSVDNNGKQTVIKLTDVLYIQGLEMNLISVAKLIVKGADIRFGKHGCRIMSRGETAAVAVLRDGLYRLKQRRWRSGQQKEIGTQFVGVLIESKRRSKKTKKREVFEYTLSGAPSLGQRKMEDPVQYHEDVVQPVYFFRASSKRRVSGRTKRKGPVERSGTVPKSRRLADPDEDENKLSRIQEEMEILTIGTRKNEA